MPKDKKNDKRQKKIFKIVNIYNNKLRKKQA